MTNHTISFLIARTERGTATFPQIISYGYGALDATMSDYSLMR